MATNNVPKNPSEDDFAEVRKRLNEQFFSPLTTRILRCLLAERDAKPVPVAVPEDVVRDAKQVEKDDDCGAFTHQSSARSLARFVLSLVPAPKPVVKWRLTQDHNRNTVAELWVDERHMASVCRCVAGDALQWQVIDTVARPEPFADLADAKARAEELCGVRKGD